MGMGMGMGAGAGAGMGAGMASASRTSRRSAFSPYVDADAADVVRPVLSPLDKGAPPCLAVPRIPRSRL